MTGASVCCGGLHDGAHLLQVVDVEGGHAVAVLGGVVEHLTQGNQGHVLSPRFGGWVGG
jgi:hypothetical protein